MSQNLGVIASVFLQSIRGLLCKLIFNTVITHCSYLKKKNYRITYFICVHQWQVLFPKIKKNSKEVGSGMASEALSAAHISKAPCVALSLGDFSVEHCLFPLSVFPLFLFLPFSSPLFLLCLLKQHLANP